MKASTKAAFALTVSLAVTSAAAHEYKAGSLEIEHPWARATSPQQKNGAAYMDVRNSGGEPDRLLAVRTGEAGSAELHATTVTGDGVAQMRAVEAVDIPPGGEAALAPVGLHVMLVGLKGPLYEGVTFPMTLVFERAGEVGVEVEVMGAGTSATVDHDAGHGEHDAGHQP